MTKEYKNVIFDIDKTEEEITTDGANGIIEGQVWLAADTKNWIWKRLNGTIEVLKTILDAPINGEWFARVNGAWQAFLALNSLTAGDNINIDNSDPRNPVFSSPDAVRSVVAGAGVEIDATDPDNPVVSATNEGTVQAVVAGDNIAVDATDPANPVVSSPDAVRSVVAGSNVNVDNSDPDNPVVSALAGSISGTSVRYWLTGDQVAVPAGTFYDTRTDKGTVAQASQSVTVNDNEKEWFATDFLDDPTPEDQLLRSGTYGGAFVISASPSSDFLRFSCEVYICDNDGYPVDAGTGLPNGDLGVPPLVVADSGLVSLESNDQKSVPLSVFLPNPVEFSAGQRIRYHISAAKEGTAGGAIDCDLLFGSDYNSYIDTLLPINSTTVENESDVEGVSVTDALNSLFNKTLAFLLGKGNNAGDQQIKGLADGTDPQDAATVSQLDAIDADIKYRSASVLNSNYPPAINQVTNASAGDILYAGAGYTPKVSFSGALGLFEVGAWIDFAVTDEAGSLTIEFGANMSSPDDGFVVTKKTGIARVFCTTKTATTNTFLISTVEAGGAGSALLVSTQAQMDTALALDGTNLKNKAIFVESSAAARLNVGGVINGQRVTIYGADVNLIDIDPASTAWGLDILSVNTYVGGGTVDVGEVVTRVMALRGSDTDFSWGESGAPEYQVTAVATNANKNAWYTGGGVDTFAGLTDTDWPTYAGYRGIVAGVKDDESGMGKIGVPRVRISNSWLGDTYYPHQMLSRYARVVYNASRDRIWNETAEIPFYANSAVYDGEPCKLETATTVAEATLTFREYESVSYTHFYFMGGIYFDNSSDQQLSAFRYVRQNGSSTLKIFVTKIGMENPSQNVTLDIGPNIKLYYEEKEPNVSLVVDASSTAEQFWWKSPKPETAGGGGGGSQTYGFGQGGTVTHDQTIAPNGAGDINAPDTYHIILKAGTITRLGWSYEFMNATGSIRIYKNNAVVHTQNITNASTQEQGIATVNVSVSEGDEIKITGVSGARCQATILVEN